MASLTQLRQLQGLPVLDLKVVTQLPIAAILATLPGIMNWLWADVWIINNEYVIREDKQDIAVQFDSKALPNSFIWAITFSWEMIPIMDWDKVELSIEPRKQALAALWVRLHNSKDQCEAEQQKLCYLIQDLDYRCELDWSRGPE